MPASTPRLRTPLLAVAFTLAAPAAQADDCPPPAICEAIVVETDEVPGEAEDDARRGEGEAETPGDEAPAPRREIPSPEAVDAPAPERSGATPIVLDSELRDWKPETVEDASPASRDAVMSTGGAIFLAGYGAPFIVGLVASAIVDDNPDAAGLIPLAVPVAGPLVTGAIYDAPEPLWALIGANAGIQAVGLVVLAIGATMDDSPEKAAVQPTANGILVRF